MTARARALRGNLTEAERVLWQHLRGDALGVRFRRQLVIDARYIVDFCAPDARLVVEVDGGQHAESTTDRVRDSYLESRGYCVLRFWNSDVLRDLDAVLTAIHDAIQAGRDVHRSRFPSPSRRGERGEALSGSTTENP